MDASWPDLHPTMAAKADRWKDRSPGELDAELKEYLRETDERSRVRVFWKLGEGFVFAGCNAHFAHDAGLGSPADVIGIDDFDRRLPWMAQAAKYRADDEE